MADSRSLEHCPGGSHCKVCVNYEFRWTSFGDEAHRHWAEMSVLFYIAFLLSSTLSWCGFVWLYSNSFSWSEWVPGVNIVYFPHGLRMVLVILFNSAGALGIALGTAIMGAELIRTNPALGLTHSAVAGLAVWLAARIVLNTAAEPSPPRLTAGGVASLSGRSLVVLAFASAVLNASGHCVAWHLFDSDAKQLEIRFATMFTGDLLGALALLYALRILVLFLDRIGIFKH